MLNSARLRRTARPSWERAQHRRNDEREGRAFLGQLGRCIAVFVFLNSKQANEKKLRQSCLLPEKLIRGGRAIG